MKHRFLHRSALCLLLLPGLAHAGFFTDSNSRLELRNHYLNRDFRNSDAPRSQAKEWAQGFTARFESGFTEGTVGLGIDAIAELGLKLDSSRDRRGTGLLPFGPTRQQPVDNFSELGLSAKLRWSAATLRLGTVLPQLPVVVYNDTRLLPSTFRGGLLSVAPANGLHFDAGRLTRANLRDSSGNDSISYAGIHSDRFDLVGGRYSLTPRLDLSYYYGHLADIYRQHFIGLQHTWPLAEGRSLRSDLRMFDSRDSGARRAGELENRNLNGMLTLSEQAHKFSLAYQWQSGDSAFPFLDGGDPYVVNLVTYNTFTRAGLDSWQVRYDYDFARAGIPGLTFMSRYTSGRGARTASGNDGREWERDTDIAYTLQQGVLKGLSLRWRNLTFRSSQGLSSDIDENRLILGYTFTL